MHAIIAATVRLRLIEEADAEFVLRLRLDERLSCHLSKVDDDLTKQRKWIRDYKVREAAREEYYFIIEATDAKACGTVRLYDFRGDSFCWGSWILRPGTPSFVAIKTAIGVYDLAFGPLGFERSHFDVRKANVPVVRFHERFGANKVREDADNVYFEYSKTQYAITRARYSRFTSGGPPCETVLAGNNHIRVSQ